MIWPGCEQLKLGKSSAFVKRDIRSLPLTDAEFEADFFLDRRSSTKRRELWKGLVIERESGALLAMEDAEWPPPTVNDLATVLAHAMCRPWFGDHQRPGVIYLRDRPQWQELLPHLQQLEIEVVLGEDLPWFGEAAIEWMQDKSARKQAKPLSVTKSKEELKRPFPTRKRTAADVPMALILWTGEMLKAGYPSLRKGIPAAYDPMSTVTIPLTADEWEAIFSQPDIAKTKKFRPRLEVVAETGQAADLSIDEWGRIMLALCGRGANREPGVCKHLLMLAGKIATSLSEALPIDGPPWAGGRWTGE